MLVPFRAHRASFGKRVSPLAVESEYDALGLRRFHAYIMARFRALVVHHHVTCVG